MPLAAVPVHVHPYRDEREPDVVGETASESTGRSPEDRATSAPTIEVGAPSYHARARPSPRLRAAVGFVLVSPTRPSGGRLPTPGASA